MKYVMFAYTFGGIQHLYPIIFPDNLVHSMIAEVQRYYKHGSKTNWVRAVPVSAGLLGETNKGWECYGKSESLKMNAHHEDSEIINTFDYFHGIGFEKRKRNEVIMSRRIDRIVKELGLDTNDAFTKLFINACAILEERDELRREMAMLRADIQIIARHRDEYRERAYKAEPEARRYRWLKGGEEGQAFIISKELRGKLVSDADVDLDRAVDEYLNNTAKQGI